MTTTTTGILEGNPYLSGWIEVICGPMFSGKTSELIRRVTRVTYANQSVIVVKPERDTRYSKTHIVSHNDHKVDAISIRDSRYLLDVAGTYNVVAVDEAQFFDNRLPDMVDRLADNGHRVIVSGLDMDYKAKPFEPVAGLLARAESVTKLSSICVVCGSTAPYTFRRSAEKSRIVLGATDKYEARCRKHFLEGMQAMQQQSKLF